MQEQTANSEEYSRVIFISSSIFVCFTALSKRLYMTCSISFASIGTSLNLSGVSTDMWRPSKLFSIWATALPMTSSIASISLCTKIFPSWRRVSDRMFSTRSLSHAASWYIPFNRTCLLSSLSVISIRISDVPIIPERGVLRSWDIALRRLALSLSLSMVSLTFAFSSVTSILSKAREMFSIMEWSRVFFSVKVFLSTLLSMLITARRFSLPFTGKESVSSLSIYSLVIFESCFLIKSTLSTFLWIISFPRVWIKRGEEICPPR